MRKARVLLVGVVACFTLGLTAPAANAVVCQDDGSGRDCDCGGVVNDISQKLWGYDIILCTQ
jgi:hypothetical protein